MQALHIDRMGKAMTVLIRNHDEYVAAMGELARVERPEPGTQDFARHDMLVRAIIAWEDTLNADNDPIDPIEVIASVMLDDEKTQADLARLFGSESRASAIMKKRRRLTVQMIYLLSKEWKIPADLLIQPYQLVSGPVG